MLVLLIGVVVPPWPGPTRVGRADAPALGEIAGEVPDPVFGAKRFPPAPADERSGPSANLATEFTQKVTRHTEHAPYRNRSDEPALPVDAFQQLHAGVDAASLGKPLALVTLGYALGRH